MSMARVLLSFNRLCIGTANGHRSITTATTPLCFRLTQVVEAEPLKKKKRIDPMVVRMREERKKRKIEKAIRRLEKHASQLKPLEEMEVPRHVLKEKEIRQRNNPARDEDIEFGRFQLQKQWSQYKFQQHSEEIKNIERLMLSRNKALEELHKESEDLWLEAIQMDPALVPYRTKGPVNTPPIVGYDTPDGEYIDTSRKWE